jgi:signal transduction histidine kinase/ligand-binding sensor domain-containing protein
VLGTVLAGVLLAGTCAFALNPALDVSQYAHTAWKIRDGFTKGTILSIAQTPDGYLWLGTEFGLVRFDGVSAVPWEPPPGQDLPGSYVRALLVARDGTLWIGTTKGLASWKGDRLTSYPEFAGRAIGTLLEDREGSVWASVLAFPPPGKLCAIVKGSVQCYGEDGRFGYGVTGLYEDRQGNLWAGVLNGLWRWKPGPPQFHPMPDEPDGVEAFGEADDGALLIGTHNGIRRLADEKNDAYPLPRAMRQFRGRRMLRDRNGGLWIGTSAQGLMHIGLVRTDLFTQSSGLSGENVLALFEDREGTVWVATDKGLDRFRDFAIPTFSGEQGLSNAPFGSVLAAADGSVWLGTLDGLKRWNHGEATAYRERHERLRPPAVQPTPVREIFGSGLPDRGVGSLFQDDRGRIWVTTVGGVGYLENDRFVAIRGVPSGIVQSIAEDTAGNLWIANQNSGLARISPGNEVLLIPWSRLGNRGPAMALAADRSQGGLWLGFYRGGVAYWKDGQILASYSAADGLGKGYIKDLWLDRDGTLWAATENGFGFWKNGRFATLTNKNGLPCDTVHWVLEDDNQSFWLYMACGLVRVARSELDAWSGQTVQATVFDTADGVRLQAINSFYSPQVAKSGGKLWFVQGGGVSFVDPRHIPFNKLPPPVHIETIKINGKEAAPAEGMELSHRNNDLEIDYTALSLTIPERVRFRYMLEGKDKEWQDVGTRRQAFYGGLAPRKYRFRVMACNNDGVWNEAGAAWNFSIVPAYYQSIWFQGLCVLAVGGLTWLLYRLRLRQIAGRLNLLYNERLAERARIARDLHDTLLQSLAGVSLQLHGIAKQAATAPEKTVALIDRVREQVDSSFREVRLKVWNLRSPELEGQGLAATLREFTERIGAGKTVRCSFAVSGEPRPCSPEVEEELLRIAQEAANNASRHAQASEIRIALEYGGNSLTLSVTDDGRGFDLEEGYRKTGHWGLKNMQERAAQIRGKCTITSAVGQGTGIEIRVPLSPWSLRNIRAKRADSSSGS